MRLMTWRRLVFLLHRWSGIFLGLLVFSWFASGIAMMYYSWPLITESRQRALLEPFDRAPPDTQIIGFGKAATRDPRVTVIGGRLLRRDGRLVYELLEDFRGGRVEAAALVDARSGQLLTPLDSARAIAFARSVGGQHTAVSDAVLVPRNDRYMMSGEYTGYFPAYRVRFSDAAGTMVYVSRDRGEVFGIVTRRTRITTWLGVVPHWLYFGWLYDRRELWTWLNLLLPGAAVVMALAGVTYGVVQLFPRRHRGEWRVSSYGGVSKWHHIAGIGFGLVVLTWSLSGVLEILGGGNGVRHGQAERARGGPVAWQKVTLGEAEAVRAARSSGALRSDELLSVTLAQSGGHPGYDIQPVTGSDVWVDAATGAVRGELDSSQAIRVALAVMPAANVASAERLDRHDSYYYAGRGREVHLPVWRVAFDDSASSALYLHTVTGAPVGFVDRGTRQWRWWRDGMHTWDFPAINGRRPLWDALVLPFMLGGLLAAATGVWLAVNRVRRLVSVSRSPGP
jgi:PepSY-associated TM region